MKFFEKFSKSQKNEENIEMDIFCQAPYTTYDDCNPSPGWDWNLFYYAVVQLLKSKPLDFSMTSLYAFLKSSVWYNWRSWPMSKGLRSNSYSRTNFILRHESNCSWFISSALSTVYSKFLPKIKSLGCELEISIVS